jgi:hypothetical protein
MSVQHAEPPEAEVYLPEEYAPVTKRRIVTGRLRRRFGLGVSNTNHRERVMLHCQEAIVTRDPFEPPGRGWATEGIVNPNQAQ